MATKKLPTTFFCKGYDLSKYKKYICENLYQQISQVLDIGHNSVYYNVQ